MKERFSNGIIETAVMTGAFGAYIANPHTNQERLELVGQAMAACRRRAGLSQKEVCELIGCKPQTYSGYEKGKHEPTIETLVRLSWLYAVSLDYLLCKNDDNGLTIYENETENQAPEEIDIQMQLMRQEWQEFKRQYATDHPDK